MLLTITLHCMWLTMSAAVSGCGDMVSWMSMFQKIAVLVNGVMSCHLYQIAVLVIAVGWGQHHLPASSFMTWVLKNWSRVQGQEHWRRFMMHVFSWLCQLFYIHFFLLQLIEEDFCREHKVDQRTRIEMTAVRFPSKVVRETVI